MSAQDYYRGDYASRPLSPPTNAHDLSDDLDRRSATDVNERTGGVPERVTTPDFDNDKFDTPPSPSHEQNHSVFSDTPGYGKTDYEEGNNPYGKNYNLANQDSKEALVPGVRDRRSSGYQDLGACSFSSLRSFISACPGANSRVIFRVRGGESNQSRDGTSGGARWEGKVCSVGRERQATFGATDTEQTKRCWSPGPSLRW